MRFSVSFSKKRKAGLLHFVSAQLLCAASLLLQGYPAQASECRLAGTWKSSEEKTLQNLKSAKLTDKQRKIFSSGLFGKLVHTYTCKTLTMTYEGDSTTVQIVSMNESGDKVIVKYYDPNDKKTSTLAVTLRGDCFSMPVEPLGFAEVFCRVK